MDSIKYQLNETELCNLICLAATEAIKVYQEEYKDLLKKIDSISNINKNMKKMLSGYRRKKKALAEDITISKDEEAEYRWEYLKDLMGNVNSILTQAEIKIVDREKRIKQEKYEVLRVEKAFDLYKQEADKSVDAEFKRRYRVLYSFYISDVPKTIFDIADKEGISDKTVYRDINTGLEVLLTYLTCI